MDPLGSIVALGASIPTIAKDEDKVAAALETAKEILMNKTMMIGLSGALGIDRARQFTWQACAQKTLAVYQRVIGQQA